MEAATVGWERLGNGELISAAESEGFEVFVSSDKNLRYQQNLFGRRIALDLDDHSAILKALGVDDALFASLINGGDPLTNFIQGGCKKP